MYSMERLNITTQLSCKQSVCVIKIAMISTYYDASIIHLLYYVYIKHR